MQFCHVIGVSLVFILSVGGVGLLVASGVSYDWFIGEGSIESTRNGLWRSCKTINNIEKCSVHDGVLEFPVQRRDEDVLIVVDIGAVASAVVGIFLILGGLCKTYRSRCLEITSSLFFVLSAICIVFMAVYLEIEIIKDSTYKRGWAVFTMYGGLGAMVLTSLFAIIYALCCRERFLEGFDKSDSLVLKHRRPPSHETKYQVSDSQYTNGIENNSYDPQKHRNFPSADY